MLDISEGLGVAFVVPHADTAEPLVVLHNRVHLRRNLPHKLDVPPLLLLHTQRRQEPPVRLHERTKVAVLDTLTAVEGADGTEHLVCASACTAPVPNYFFQFFLGDPKAISTKVIRMDFVEEFEDSRALTPQTVATYSFFRNFSVDVSSGTLTWTVHSATIDTPTAEKLKHLLKYFRSKLKTQELNRDGCGRAMLFWFSKIQELGCFSFEVRSEIRAWMEICELIVS